ncbi:hypothetical protein AB0M43_31340 [Longispora sp. NPDC051575]|uniref:hypothetical protein n=1 Tax=Longispora sp. NPDC051575 TaxID=3154943 RepID=UPI00343CC8A1
MKDGVADRTRLEYLIRRSEHTIDEWCARFDRAARVLGEPATLSARQLQRWMAGQVGTARPSARRVAGSLWREPFAVLVGPVGAAGNAPVPVRTAGYEAAHQAARESAEHVRRMGIGVREGTVERLRAEVRRLAYTYVEVPPSHFLAEARRARDTAYTLLERTRRPAQLAELSLVAAQLCGLMSAASFDMAAWSPALAQAGAAHAYADLAGHVPLRAWARGNLALMAHWPRRTPVPVEDALAPRPRGAAAAGLRCVEARAWADPTGPARGAPDGLDAEQFVRLRQALGGARWLHDGPAAELLERIHVLHRQTMVNGA